MASSISRSGLWALVLAGVTALAAADFAPDSGGGQRQLQAGGRGGRGGRPGTRPGPPDANDLSVCDHRSPQATTDPTGFVPQSQRVPEVMAPSGTIHDDATDEQVDLGPWGLSAQNPGLNGKLNAHCRSPLIHGKLW